METVVKYKTDLKRLEYIDLFRGFGIILMIMGHIGFGNIFDHWIHAFHMPMFFIISGYLWKDKKIPFKTFFFKKVKSLLLPYITFGTIFSLFIVIKGDLTIKQAIYHVLWDNTSGLTIGGAIWFLTAIFFVDILYYLISNLNHSNEIINSIIIFVIATYGTLCRYLLSFRLPLALDAAFVGLGLYQIGRYIKKFENKNINFELFRDKKKLCSICAVGIIIVYGMIFSNGYINMREGIYANIELFWLNAVLSSWLGITISKVIGYKKCYIFSIIKYIGKNSIVYLCLNQFVILCSYKFLSILIINIIYLKIGTLILTILALFVSSEIIMKTGLKFFVGK